MCSLKRLVFLLLLLCSLLPVHVFASSQIITTKGAYIASSSESINDAKQKALNDALRQAAEQAGVLVISSSKVKDALLTEDEVKLIAARVLHICSQKYSIRTINSDSIEATAYVEVSIDTDNIDSYLNDIVSENKVLNERNRALELDNKEMSNKLDYYQAIDSMEKHIKEKYTMEKVRKMHPWTYKELLSSKRRGFIEEIALAHYYMAQKKWDNAFASLQKSSRDDTMLQLAILGEVHNNWRRNIDFGEVYFMRRQYDAAAFHFKLAYKTLSSVPTKNDLAKLRLAESEYYLKMSQRIMNKKKYI